MLLGRLQDPQRYSSAPARRGHCGDAGTRGRCDSTVRDDAQVVMPSWPVTFRILRESAKSTSCKSTFTVSWRRIDEFSPFEPHIVGLGRRCHGECRHGARAARQPDARGLDLQSANVAKSGSIGGYGRQDASKVLIAVPSGRGRPSGAARSFTWNVTCKIIAERLDESLRRRQVVAPARTVATRCRESRTAHEEPGGPPSETGSCHQHVSITSLEGLDSVSSAVGPLGPVPGLRSAALAYPNVHRDIPWERSGWCTLVRWMPRRDGLRYGRPGVHPGSPRPPSAANAYRTSSELPRDITLTGKSEKCH